MPRPAGVRNHDFDAKRKALLDALTHFALTDDLRRPSLRQFAIAAETSEPTLRHYFKDRKGVVIAILEHIHNRAVPLWGVIETPAETPAKAVEEYYRVSQAGMRHAGFARAHAFGLIEGLADPVVGRAYLEFLLNPALEAAKNKMEATGDSHSAHAAAFMMMSPMLVMTLHQHLLGGDEVAPIDQNVMLVEMQNLLVSGVGIKN